jgi:DNA polymerase I-like protein with 3'-5' exonuclease and polymerase domains
MDRQERSRAERMMMSSIISGTSADLLKEIMLRTRPVLRTEYGHLPYLDRGRQVQTIHDENIYDLPIAGVGLVIPKLMQCYTHWPMFEQGGVPIRASVEVSTTTWENKRAIKVHEDGTFSWAA